MNMRLRLNDCYVIKGLSIIIFVADNVLSFFVQNNL